MGCWVVLCEARGVFTFVIRDLGGCWKGQEVGPIIDGVLHPIIDGVFHPRSSAPHSNEAHFAIFSEG